MPIAELTELVLKLMVRVDSLEGENAHLKEENRQLKEELAVAKKSRSSLR